MNVTHTARARAEEAMHRCIAENGMEPLLSRGVLLALSGGADSVLLFHLLLAYTRAHAIPFAALHVHHGIRGAEADRDAAFCADLCAAADVPLFVEHVDAMAYAQGKGHGRGLEYAARTLRYAAIASILQHNPQYGVCATAHNATDNIETVFLHMMRGSGLRGLCGIPPVRDVFVRPLLYVAKRDVLAAVAEAGWDYVTDSTNEETNYDRNYIRKEILPRLLPLRKDPEAAVTRLCANLRDEDAVLAAEAAAFLDANAKGGTLSRKTLLTERPAIACRALSCLAAPLVENDRPERAHLCAFLSLLGTTRAHGRYSMPGGLCAVFDRDAVFFEAEDAEPFPAYDISLTEGHHVLPNGAGEIWIRNERDTEFEKAQANVYNLFIQAKLDSATIWGKLSARTRRAGDAYRSGGMTRRVRRLMSDAHLPQKLRAMLPHICDEKGILWVPGFGVRDAQKAEEGGHALYLYYGCQYLYEESNTPFVHSHRFFRVK